MHYVWPTIFNAFDSGMNAICRVLNGFVADRIGRVTTLAATTFLSGKDKQKSAQYHCIHLTLFSGIFTMLIWQLSDRIGTYIAFAVLFGLTTGTYNSLIPIATAEVAGMKNIQRGTGVCLFLTIFTNATSFSIASILQSTFGWTAAIQFVGAIGVVAGLIALAVRLTMPKKVYSIA